MTRPFYVYVLATGEDEPFYVGMGSGLRAVRHIFYRDPTGGLEKQAVIDRLRDERRPITIRIVGWFDTAREARACERQLIDRHGIRRDRTGPLTNGNRSGTGAASGAVRVSGRARAILEPEARAARRSMAAQLEVMVEEWASLQPETE